MRSSLWNAPVALGTCLAGITALLAGEAVSGGPYRLVGGPVSGGGVVSGGGFTMDSAAGEIAPGVGQGGGFELAGTLYSVSVVAGEFRLTVSDLGDGRIAVEWPAAAAGYVLETALELGETPRWEPVAPPPAGHVYVVLGGNPAQQFFRLRKK